MAGKREMGSTLTLNGEGSEADVVVGNIASIGGIKTDTAEVDTTTLDSPNGAKEFVQGAKDSGDFDVEINNVFNGQIETLNSIFNAGETRSWTIAYKDGSTVLGFLDFNAYIKTRAFGDVTPDGLHKVTLTLRVSGGENYTEGSTDA